MGADGLSANFTGKNNEKMSRVKFENKTFNMTVKNDTDQDLTFALTKGTFPNLEEIKKKYSNVDAILADGDFFETNVDGVKKKANCKVIGASSVAHFQEFYSHGYEGEIVTLQMNSTDKENFYEVVEAVLPTPFEATPARITDLSEYLSPDQYDQNRVLAPNIRIPLSPLAMVTFRIRAKSKIDFSFRITSWDR